MDKSVVTREDSEMESRESEKKLPDVEKKLPDLISRENDDLPALLISDSEEEDVQESNTSQAGRKFGDKMDKKKSKNVTPVKDTSQMTAQELLQSLIGDHDEFYSEKPSREKPPAADCSDMIRFSTVASEGQQKECPPKDASTSSSDETPNSGSNEELDTQNQDEAVESQKVLPLSATETVDMDADTECSTTETAEKVRDHDQSPIREEDLKTPSAMDEDCLLEEIPNPTERQQNECIADDVSTTNLPCSNAEETEELNLADDEPAVETSTILNDGESENDCEAIENGEPPRKKVRSMDAISDVMRGSNSETTVNSHGEEIDIDEVQEINAINVDQTEMSEVSSKKNENVSESKEQSATILGSYLTAENPASGGESNICNTKSPEPPTTCTDILVIDDDDEDEKVDLNGSNGLVLENSMNSSSASVSIIEENEKVKVDNSVSANLQDRKLSVRRSSTKHASDDSKINVSPEPPIGKKETLRMEILRRFDKSLHDMTRHDLEQLFVQKISEIIVYKSELAEMRKLIERQEMVLEAFKRKGADLTKHVGDLQIVTDRAVADLKKRSKCFVAPVKITRAVGLQVSKIITLPEGMSHHPMNMLGGLPDRFTNGFSNPNVQERVIEGSRYAAHQAPGRWRRVSSVGGSPLSSNPGSTNVLRPSLANGSNITNNLRRRSHVVRRTTDVAVATNITTNRIATSVPSNNVPSAPSNNNSPAPSTSSAGSGSTTVEGGLRKSIQKFTPLRPPLSHHEQQIQKKQVRMQQELLMQQIREQSMQTKRNASETSPQEQSVGQSSATRQAGESVTRQRGLPPSVRSAYMTGEPIALNHSPDVPASTVKSPASSAVNLPSPTVQTMPKTASPAQAVTAGESLIDLTDEDDVPIKSQDGVASTLPPKRPRSSLNGTAAASALKATNQLVRINQAVVRNQQRTVVDSTKTTASAATNGSTGVAHQNNSGGIRKIPVKSPMSAESSRAVGNVSGSSRRAAVSSTDHTKIRLIVKHPQQAQARLVPLPHPGPQLSNPAWKHPPPQPTICVNNVQTGIVISWSMPTLTDLHASIDNYQIYAYQEVSSPSPSDEWRHVGDVRALLLPMAVTLTQFQEGQRYHFAVRAIDEHKRIGEFSEPRTWNDASTLGS